MAFGPLTELGSLRFYLVPNHFRPLKRKPHTHEAVTPIPHFPQPLETTNLLSVSVDYLSRTYHRNENIHVVAFCASLLSLTVTFLRFTHIVQCSL